VGSRCSTFTLISGGDTNTSIRHSKVAQDAAEELKRGLWLVVRDLVAGVVDAREAKVAILPRLAVLDAVDDKGRVARGSELLRVRVVDLE
jgi:hypothetical protein